MRKSLSLNKYGIHKISEITSHFRLPVNLIITKINWLLLSPNIMKGITNIYRYSLQHYKYTKCKNHGDEARIL